MALFELFIPAADPSGFNVTARVRADSWMQALRAGLAKLGDTSDVRNVIVDITEQGIDVTEPHSGRVFRIHELPEAAGQASASSPGTVLQVSAPAVANAPTQAAAPSSSGLTPAAPPASPQRSVFSEPDPPPSSTAPMQRPAATAASAARPAGAAATAAPAYAAGVRQAPPPAALGAPPAARPAAARTAPTAAAIAAARPSAAPRPAVAATPAAPRFVAQVQEEIMAKERPSAASEKAIGRARAASEVSTSDDTISDLFAQTQALYDKPNLRAAADYILDLAMKSVQADSGAVFIADISASDLYFAAARGPKAQEVMKFRVPLGAGIVGFCAQEGVALAVSDVHRDPRFYAAISKNIGYETRSILCAPAQVSGRVVGAIELINKRSGTSFTGGEISVLNFLAHEFADYMINTEQTGA